MEDAGLDAAQIDYVNAHGTATDHGDIAETQATAQVFGSRVPISSLKSYVGHMLGACGAFEAWVSIQMMRAGWFAPTLNLARSTRAVASSTSSPGRAANCRPST